MENPFKNIFKKMEKDKEVLEQEALQNETEAPEKDVENAEKQEETVENEDTALSEVDKIKNELEEAKQKYLYLFSDFNNFRRNAAKERGELITSAGRDIMSAILPILDDFDRADANEGLNEGTKLIYQKLLTVLQGKFLKEMEIEKGDDFDAEKQEAIANIPAPSEDMKGKIIDVVEKGYYLGDKIIRHAKVVVGQ